MRLHHIGMAVPDIGAALRSYAETGARVGAPFKADGIDYMLAYVETGGTPIELVQPLSDGSTAANFLKRNPAGGIYHLGYEVENLSAAAAHLRHHGAIDLGNGQPRREADGTAVLVLDATVSHGTVIELREPPRRSGLA